MEKTLIFDNYEVVKRFIKTGFTKRQQAYIVIQEQKKIIENNLAEKKITSKSKKKLFS